MVRLNLPEYSFRIRETQGKQEIFDAIRRKFVALTSEEWVRQNFVQYLVRVKRVPWTLVAIEKKVVVNRMPRRCDILVHNNRGEPQMIVECKAPGITLDQAVFDQVARYNMPLRVNYLVVTNGLVHYCCRMDYSQEAYRFLEDIPEYQLLNE